MSYTIKNTGGVLNIGQLMDFDGEIVDIATNKAAITATLKDAAGNSLATIAVAEGGDDYDCKITITPVTTLPLDSQTIRLSSTTDAIISRNVVINVLTVAAYNNLHSGTDTQAIITGLNVLGSRSLNDLYGSNNQLIP